VPDSRTRSKRALRRPHCPHVPCPRPSAASPIASSATASGVRRFASPPWARLGPADDLSCSRRPTMYSVTKSQGYSLRALCEREDGNAKAADLILFHLKKRDARPVKRRMQIIERSLSLTLSLSSSLSLPRLFNRFRISLLIAIC